MFSDYDVVLWRIDHPEAVREVYVNWSLARAMTAQTRAIVDLMLAHPTPPALLTPDRAVEPSE
ncbi:hypothetical protein [Streptomyces canus]|uniref:hypothetical protein n=1 Tax=Streptomyces canus TaxID=58343 RepID=UPI002DDC109E|nr:hypothetical protein [Streptomyces canus]WSD83072.1 hypothetical protein OG925_01340 [Streptomyces canus]